jgi:hypothetical protein
MLAFAVAVIPIALQLQQRRHMRDRLWPQTAP